MKILVFGAAGDVGSRVVAEAIARGHNVSAVARRQPPPGRLPGDAQILLRDVSSAGNLKELIEEHDLVVSALRPRDGEEAALLALTEAVMTPTAKAGVPSIIVGGAAVLRMPDASGYTLLTAPGVLPEAYRPIAEASAAQYEWWKQHADAQSSYIIPPAELAPGERRGVYRAGTDTMLLDAEGASRISMEDFAIAIVDEAEQARSRGQAFTVAW